MRYRLWKIAALGAALVFAEKLDAQSRTIGTFVMPDARAQALGGFHAALTDDAASAFNNPAGFAALRPLKSFAELNIEFNNVDSLYTILNEEITIQNAKKLVSDRIDASAVVGGPLSVGAIGDGFGWRLCNATRVRVFWDRNEVFVIYPSLSEEWTFDGGFGFRLALSGDATLDMGFSAQAFYRLIYEPGGVFLQEARHLLAELDERPYASEMGFALNTGLRWTKNDAVSLALNCRNVYTPVWYAKFRDVYQYLRLVTYETGLSAVAPELSVGFTARLPSPVMHRWNTDLIFSADYNGMHELFKHDKSRNPLLQFSAGLELRTLEVVSLRAGVADLLPSGGLGIDFTVFQLDLALFGRVQGGELNGRKTWRFGLSIHFHGGAAVEE